ncbi:hypothetical protein G6L95_06645 [Agrobacterium rhizogenes]|nr:hypothetical protein [Rhizobium rhizogenes]NTI54629.1 hypothetical protein [Rhizobium rhizogenes]
MAETIPASRQALSEALALAEVILQNIELSELPLAQIVLKASRLARLLNDYDYQKIFEYEASGYPSEPDGMPLDIWRLTQKSGRTYLSKEKEKQVELAYTGSVSSLEDDIESGRRRIDAARDPNLSLSSANPHQIVANPLGNLMEREAAAKSASQATKRLAARRGFVHSYVSGRYYELKFSNVAGDIFSRIRESVDTDIGAVVPSAIQKFSAIYENLTSDNAEDWSNAVHSCRRLLQDLADALFPGGPDRTKGSKTIKMGADNYINRLIAFVEDKSDSDRFNAIVGSSLGFMGDRLDAVFQAAQKGSHSTITSREEADRYVLYTYMILGDIISLSKPSDRSGPGVDGGDSDPVKVTTV